MKKNFLIQFMSLGVLFFVSSQVSAQWTKTVMPDPPYGHGALPGRVSCLAATDSTVYAGTLGGNIYLSRDNGKTWTYIDSGLTTSDITTILPLQNTVLVGAYGNISNATFGMYGTGSGVYISTNSGIKWTKAGPSLADTNIYTLATIDSTIFVGTWGGGVYTSADNGRSWSQDNNGLTNMKVRVLTPSGKRMYAGTWGDGVFFSDDDALSWAQSNAGINNPFIYDIAVDSPNVYMCNTEGVYFSSDSAHTWSIRDSGLTTTYVNTFIVLHPDLFVGTSGQGVFVSLNTGTSWTVIDTGLTDGYIYCFAQSNSRLFAGSSNGEVWSMPLSSIMAKVTAIKEKSQTNIASGFNLLQNYPNPFNPSTRITYQLSERSHVQLRVYDALGRLLSTLVDGNESVGSHDVAFNAAGLSSGVYFYQIRIGDNISTKKMVLMK